MVTKIDTKKLGEHICELTSLKAKIDNYAPEIFLQEDNCGRTVSKMIEIEKTLQLIQDGLVSLVSNTILYMEQRKISVETKEQTATEEVSK